MKHKHIEDPSKGMPFRVCKLGHVVPFQRYCKICGKPFCKQCAAGDKTVNQEALTAQSELRQAGF